MIVGDQITATANEATGRADGRAWFRLPKGWRKPVIYRFARATHGYLSAFAFIGLIFFAASGFLLNHPEWFADKRDARQVELVQLPDPLIVEALKQDDKGAALARLLESQTVMAGEFASAEILDEDAMLRFTGVKANVDVFIDLASGEAEIETARSGVMAVIRDLHRGKEAGAVWRLLIDVIAIVTLVLSLVGFFLFFTMRFRLATSLKLTAASLAAMVAIFVFGVS
ncbi:MAG: hypothetical protein CME88_15345 [Hirschia sp.]|nr:hypothetical protein [Hirschia sp.]MBB37300.1 hypothetical protein [Hirschia sp.]MBF19753.1 hypothetical protein [Hirschia sp.]